MSKELPSLTTFDTQATGKEEESPIKVTLLQCPQGDLNNIPPAGTPV